MLFLDALPRRGSPFRILCVGAHCDDIEIGCGGTILTLLETFPDTVVWWVAFSSAEPRREEAIQSAERFLAEACAKRIVAHTFRDGFFPFVGAEIKECFEQLKRDIDPDLIFTHSERDRHQDHRLICELTWNTFRNHLIFEYEIPKYDGDLGSPNVFVPLDEAVCGRKIKYILESFRSQEDKAILCLRGIEARAPTRFAEAFYCRKLVVGLGARPSAPGGEGA